MSTRVLGDAVSEQALQETTADREKKKGALTDSWTTLSPTGRHNAKKNERKRNWWRDVRSGQLYCIYNKQVVENKKKGNGDNFRYMTKDV